MLLHSIYVPLNPVPRCNAYDAYTILYEHWIAKLGLPESWLQIREQYSILMKYFMSPLQF